MDLEEYHKMDQAEDEMWWYRSLHRRLYRAICWKGAPSGAAVLDAGCGTGGFLAFLRKANLNWQTQGLEWLPAAAERARAKSGVNVLVGSVNHLPWEAATFDVIVSADVLCHREVDPVGALREMRRCLKDSGFVVLNLPAFSWIMSYHDLRVHTVRRFTTHTVRELLADACMELDYASYWNTLLFPFVVLRRKVVGSWWRSTSDVMRYPPWLNHILDGLMKVEERWQSPPRKMGFGLSLLCIASPGRVRG